MSPKSRLDDVHGIGHVHGRVNMRYSVNNRKLSGAGLEHALAVRLAELLQGVGWLEHGPVQRDPRPAQRPFDLRVELRPAGRKKIQLLVQCQAEPRPSKFPAVFVTREGGPDPVRVLAAPFISPRMAELCKEQDWSWFDLAGNYRLDVPGLLHIQQAGKPPAYKRPRPMANLGTPEAGRVVRALLHPEHAGMRWTQRHLAEHFGQLERPIPEPSLGLVNKVVSYLQEEAFIEPAPDRGFRLREPLKLLYAWRDAYRFDRHERRDYFSLLQGSKLRDALHKLGLFAGGYAAYAAFSAADIQAPHVRQPKTWLYLRAQELARFEELVAAKPVDSGENLVVLLPDDEGVFYLGDGGYMDSDRLACTNAVQTYVDVWHCGGRGQEAAEAVLEQKLKPAWKAKGLKL